MALTVEELDEELFVQKYKEAYKAFPLLPVGSNCKAIEVKLGYGK